MCQALGKALGSQSSPQQANVAATGMNEPARCTEGAAATGRRLETITFNIPLGIDWMGIFSTLMGSKESILTPFTEHVSLSSLKLRDKRED